MTFLFIEYTIFRKFPVNLRKTLVTRVYEKDDTEETHNNRGEITGEISKKKLKEKLLFKQTNEYLFRDRRISTEILVYQHHNKP